MNATEDVALQVEGVSFAYPAGVEALRDVSLSVAPGEAVGIIGENGAGKTTFVKHLNGLLKPDEGRVLVKGHDTRDYTAATLARCVGLVFQNPDDQLFQNSVRKEVALGPRNLGLDEQEVDERVQWALELVEMEGPIDVHPYDLGLSGRKLVAIATIVAMDPPVVVLDEPTTGQDHVGSEVLERVVEELRNLHKTVIAISHDMDFIARNFPRVVTMAHAEVLLDGPAKEVFARPDVLAEAGVSTPALGQLARHLGWEEVPFTVEEFVEVLGGRARGIRQRIGNE
jgi:energy-coupling factor transport system ATP-binding protein